MRGTKAKALRRATNKLFGSEISKETLYNKTVYDPLTMRPKPIKMKSCFRKEYQRLKYKAKNAHILSTFK